MSSWTNEFKSRASTVPPGELGTHDRIRTYTDKCRTPFESVAFTLSPHELGTEGETRTRNPFGDGF